jgi:hypothetical protein
VIFGFSRLFGVVGSTHPLFADRASLLPEWFVAITVSRTVWSTSWASV